MTFFCSFEEFHFPVSRNKNAEMLLIHCSHTIQMARYIYKYMGYPLFDSYLIRVIEQSFKFVKKLLCCVGGGGSKTISYISTVVKFNIANHPSEFVKLMFRALAFRQNKVLLDFNSNEH